MIAALPMYLRRENRAAHDAFWALTRDGLRARGIAAPDALSHDAPIAETWARPDLVIGQICNFPYRTAFADRVTLIGAGDYGLPDAGPGEYYSVFVARAEDPRTDPIAFSDEIFAYNAADSQSGWAAPALHLAARKARFGQTVRTGWHAESARAVAEGRAALAAIDAVTWQGIARWDAYAKKLRVIARTAPSPGLSFITAGTADPAPYRAALAETLEALPPEHRDVLGLKRIVPLDRQRYTTLPIPEAPPS